MPPGLASTSPTPHSHPPNAMPEHLSPLSQLQIKLHFAYISVKNTPTTSNTLDIDWTAILQTDIEKYKTHQTLTPATTPHTLAILENRPAKLVVEELARQTMDIVIDAATRLAPTICQTKQTNPTGIHYRPRKAAAERKLHMKVRKKVRTIASKLKEHDHLPGDPDEDTDNFIAQMKQYTALHTCPTSDEDTTKHDPAPDHIAALQRIEQAASAAIRKIDRDHQRLDQQQAATNLQQTLDKHPKKGHKMIFGNKQPYHRLTAVHDHITGKPTMDPDKVTRNVEKHFTDAMRPPTGAKTGHYLPQDAPRQYPWEDTSAPDKFKLTTDTTHTRDRSWLLQHVQDEQLFFDCCRTLSSGKAPGPDQVTNDIILMLPTELKKHIHKLFIIMWATGVTPTEWKQSHTCLIHKKGDPLDINNYRPIGLANTMYKLWTRVVTYVMYEYAEENRILSGMQSGFRKHTGTHRQLQMLVMALEDAKLTSQDIYQLQVDFSSAFNMTDHDLTLQLLYDLGYPTDAIEVVKDIYTDAMTQYKTPYGTTNSIPIGRGTLQGDTLSPFLFLIYIEPLLRWLQVGGRGYKFGAPCTTTEPQYWRVQTACSNLAYADDLEILTSRLSDLKIQADKLTRYSNWAHMKVNTNKTITSGVLYNCASNGLLGNTNPLAPTMLSTQLNGHIMVQGHPVVFQHPTDPFTYLGVVLTMTLN